VRTYPDRDRPVLVRRAAPVEDKHEGDDEVRQRTVHGSNLDQQMLLGKSVSPSTVSQPATTGDTADLR